MAKKLSLRNALNPAQITLNKNLADEKQALRILHAGRNALYYQIGAGGQTILDGKGISVKSDYKTAGLSHLWIAPTC